MTVCKYSAKRIMEGDMSGGWHENSSCETTWAVQMVHMRIHIYRHRDHRVDVILCFVACC